MYDNIKDKDINEVFDDILLFEENVIEEAYEEGFKIGVQQGNKEGYHLGFHRGSEIGAEIGFYLGVVEKYLELYSKSTDEKFSKPKSSLENLKKILSEFPRSNSAEIDVFEALDTIRAQFKKVCAQMKVNISYPGKSNMSF
ncbi:protein LTO1 homolog [Diabrotica virgifera virgifera]|uniref:Essential protein Yae1 N-terminal domain-containing protein n=1 Tax=Diabrotica virgifera virgifera TaxID=50390 RepID=A0ABM5KAI4_DIAVI|nr:protein LTO1 homolog [Diabrotica virgifera virgifera]